MSDVATIERTDSLDMLVRELRDYLDHVENGAVPGRGILSDIAKRFEKRLNLERGKDSANGRRTQVQKLAGMLSIQTGVEVDIPRDRERKVYVVTWEDGPTVVEMQALVADFAGEVPAVDTGALEYDRTTSPEPVQVDVAPPKPIAEPTPAPLEEPKSDAEPSTPEANGQPVIPVGTPEPAYAARPRSEPMPIRVDVKPVPPLFPDEPAVRRDDDVHREPRPSTNRRRKSWRARFVDALLPTGMILAIVAAAIGFGVIVTDSVRGYLDQQVAERTTHEVTNRLNLCHRALDRADDSIFSYFDGVRAERETTVSTPTREVRVRTESDAYKRYVESRDECRGIPQKPREPVRLGGIEREPIVARWTN